jgi:hypothetical protein
MQARSWYGLTLLLIGGGVAALAQPVNYENHPYAGPVNISGATLFRPFFEAPASTHDAIDVDGDLFSGYDPNTFPFVDQLGASFTPSLPLNTFWAVQYRGVGSVNGLGEFVWSQLCDLLSGSVPSELGLLNRYSWAIGGARQLGSWPDCLTVAEGEEFGYRAPDGNFQNDSGTPVCVDEIQIAILDVPSKWGVIAGDELNAYWHKGPTQDGYGQNPILSSTGWDSALQSLTRDCGSGPVSLNSNTANPDQNTIYDSTVAWAGIAYVANRGVGRPDLNTDGLEGDIALTDVRHLMLTGRTMSGENLAGATRSAGSGTRNGIFNTSGIDPSWGRGDNLDNEWNSTNAANIGPNRRVTNAEGSSGVERAVQVSRLAVGFTGLFGNERAIFDATAGRYEVLNIQFDDRGGSAYVRPSITNIVQNCDPNTAFQLGGQVTFVTRGDPSVDDPNLPEYMEDRAPAFYLRNILGSIAQVVGAPSSPENFNMPGEYLATRFTLEAGMSCLPTPDNPTQFVTNPNLNVPLQNFIISNTTQVLPAYGSKNPAGLVPRRATTSEDPNVTQTWLDGTLPTQTTYRYKGSGGLFYTINRDARLGGRNRVTGDFNRDGLRNVNDIAGLLEAYVSPLDYEQGDPVMPGNAGDQTGGNVVIVHIMADFNGDGNFDAADVRYFADGLTVDPNAPNGKYGPVLSRKLGFQLVDTNWATQPGGDTNFFNSTLATPKTYALGDSAGDVAGNVSAPGADPRGDDGVVNATDIDYVYAQFKNTRFGWNNTQADWFNPDQAVFFDLSADMTGPEVVLDAWKLVIDQQDLDYLVQVILGTEYGDADLDGDVDANDEAIVQAHLGQPGGWAAGNFDGDETVDADDLALFGHPGDLDCNGIIEFDDINPFVLAISSPEAYQASYPNCRLLNGDCNGDGLVDFDDINPFVVLLSAGAACP